jgi:hypothetical protein
MRNIAVIVVLFLSSILLDATGEDSSLVDAIKNKSTSRIIEIAAANQGLPDSVELISPTDAIFDIPPGVNCVWHQVNGVKKYQFQCGKTESFTSRDVDTIIIGDTTVHISLSKVTKYYWRVAAIVTATGPWSEVWSFVTGPLTATCAAPVTHTANESLSYRFSSVIYNVPSASWVNIQILTLDGELQQTVCNAFHQSGFYRIHIPESKQSSGYCILLMTAGNRREAKLLFQQ